jgi:hypothetical protein
MEKSNEIAELAKALVAFQKEIKTVGYDAKNPFFKSEYATLGALVEESRSILTKNGLAVSQLTEDEGAVTTILMHVSGQFISSKLKLTPAKHDPQGLGSSITYARRYAYAAILGLVSDKDDDGNEATGLNKKQEQIQPVVHRITPQSNGNGSHTSNSSDEQKITTEQGEALLAMLAKNGYNAQDLKEMIFFDLQLEKLSEIKNKHLLTIKKAFSNPKKVEA